MPYMRIAKLKIQYLILLLCVASVGCVRSEFIYVCLYNVHTAVVNDDEDKEDDGRRRGRTMLCVDTCSNALQRCNGATLTNSAHKPTTSEHEHVNAYYMRVHVHTHTHTQQNRSIKRNTKRNNQA